MLMLCNVRTVPDACPRCLSSILRSPVRPRNGVVNLSLRGLRGLRGRGAARPCTSPWAFRAPLFRTIVAAVFPLGTVRGHLRQLQGGLPALRHRQRLQTTWRWTARTRATTRHPAAVTGTSTSGPGRRRGTGSFFRIPVRRRAGPDPKHNIVLGQRLTCSSARA